jgi:hypothetical protein
VATAAAVATPSAIATPPTRGTAPMCTFLDPGRSTSDHLPAARISTGIQAIVTTMAMRKGSSNCTVDLVGHVARERGRNLRRELGESAIGDSHVASRRHGGHQPHQRAIGALASQRIPE